LTGQLTTPERNRQFLIWQCDYIRGFELRMKILIDMGTHICEYGLPYYEDNH
jgi:hypothetical protein